MWVDFPLDYQKEMEMDCFWIKIQGVLVNELLK